MPFTLLHPAAILPVARSPLVPSALVAGAVAPDLPYYVSLRWLGGDYNLTLTHDVGSVVWLDALIALTLLAVFHGLLKAPLVALLPRPAAARVVRAADAFRWRTPAAFGWIVASVVVGAVTHVGWDALCDAFGYRWSTRLNLASDVVGGVALLGWLAHWWRTTPPAPLPRDFSPAPRVRRAVVGAAVLLTAAWTTVGGLRTAARVGDELRAYGVWSRSEVAEHVVRGAVVDAATALGLLVGLYAVAWHLHRRQRDPGRLAAHVE